MDSPRQPTHNLCRFCNGVVFWGICSQCHAANPSSYLAAVIARHADDAIALCPNCETEIPYRLTDSIICPGCDERVDI